MPVRANKPKNSVHNLDVVETALVDDGDNPGAKIVLFKERPAPVADAGTKDGWTPLSTAERLAKNEFMEDFYEVRCAYVESINEILWAVPATEMGALLERSTTEFEAAVTTLLDGIAKRAPALVKAGRDLMAKAIEAAATKDPATITKALEAFGAAPQDKENDMPMPSTTTNDPKAANAAKHAKTMDEILASLPEAERAAVKAALDAKAATPPPADPAVNADVEAVKAAAKATEERLKAAEADLAKMRDEKVNDQMKAKATAIGVGDVDTTAALLKAAYAQGDEHGKKLEDHLKSLASQVKKNNALTKAIGSDNPTGITADGAVDPLEAKAKEIQAANKGMTSQQAYAKAVETYPDLASEAYGTERTKRAQAAAAEA